MWQLVGLSHVLLIFVLTKVRERYRLAPNPSEVPRGSSVTSGPGARACNSLPARKCRR